MDSLVVFSPAKINFHLAVTGRRADGFHDLISIVAPLTFGDTLRLQRTRGSPAITLTCDRPDVPTGSANLAVRAAEAFQQAAGVSDGVAIDLTKRIPMGAGLGGGSSNAVAVLRGLNVVHGEPLSLEQLSAVAATIGSDCPLFLAGGVCVMRGRGEQVSHLTPPMRHRFAKARLLVFKPDFGVPTPWAYGQLVAAGPSAYADAVATEARIAAWFAGTAPVGALLFNSFEAVVCRKFVALRVLADALRAMRGVEGVLLSGSGSACFAVLAAEADTAALTAKIHETLGPHAFVVESAVG